VKNKNRLKGNNTSDLPYIKFTTEEKMYIRRLALSDQLKNRKLAFGYLELGTFNKSNYKFIVGICDILIPSRNHYVRWQSFLLMGSFIENNPELIWPIVEKWGCVKNRDIRVGIGVCILEHLLEHHFSEYFPKVQSTIEEGNIRFIYTLAACYNLAKDPKDAVAFDRVLIEYAKKHKVKLRYMKTNRDSVQVFF
jgi:hypothetical protein